VSLIEHLRERNVLLIFNHCDQVRLACAQLVETILRTCPDVCILATSDQAFGIALEKCHFVAG
jgi:non-specific serine/threonine protein kinase